MLSELLNIFRLQAKIYNNAQFCGNWQIKAHELGQTSFHLVTHGQCKMIMEGHDEEILTPGDLVVFPREMEHLLAPLDNDPEKSSGRPMALVTPNEFKPGTAILCGLFKFEHKGFNHLLDALPEVFVIKALQAPWIEPLLQQIRNEMLNPQALSEDIINRLSELLFIYALRYQIVHCSQLSFLSLFMNSALEPALNCIKHRPEKNWTIESLAQACAMSRTKFSQLFKKISGMTVNEYLTWWRMQLAYSYLKQGLRIAQVAEKVGYQSEAAFSRTFKKSFSITPGSLR